MLDFQLIDNTIEELENEDTNFANCQKLASLYTIKQFYENHLKDTQKVESELNDILPSYRQYQEVKRHYQMSEATDTQVVNSLQVVCKEISEFIHTLYSSTDMQDERDVIQSMVSQLNI